MDDELIMNLSIHTLGAHLSVDWAHCDSDKATL